MSGPRVVLVGATGMVGGHALSIALSDPEVERVTTVGRRATGRTHPKLHEVVHADLTDCASIADALRGHDAALFCVGAYSGALSDDDFRRVTVDMPLGFGRTLHDGSPGATFCLLSGAGADPTERSRVAFARYKGMAENGLAALGFDRLHLFRPNYIYPVEPRQEPNLTYRITRALYPVLRRVWPNGAIRSDDLARAMVHAGLHGTGDHLEPVLENRDIRALVARLA